MINYRGFAGRLILFALAGVLRDRAGSLEGPSTHHYFRLDVGSGWGTNVSPSSLPVCEGEADGHQSESRGPGRRGKALDREVRG